MENQYTDKFGSYVIEDESIETARDEYGRFFRATIKYDTDAGAPWENEDGHGPVSEWRSIESKRPGERALVQDRGSARFYDVQEAVKIAKEDGWDAEPFGQGTPGERAARAVEQDYKVLKAWCEDEWRYVGIIISLHQETEDGDVIELADNLASLWGIEANYPDSDNSYLTDTANELLEEAKATSEAKRVLSTVE